MNAVAARAGGPTVRALGADLGRYAVAGLLTLCALGWLAWVLASATYWTLVALALVVPTQVVLWRATWRLFRMRREAERRRERWRPIAG